jgi:cell division protein FtsZ
MGILTVGIVTMPFTFEGRKRKTVAEEGVQELKDNVDTIIIINNDKLREIYGNLNAQNAFAKANDVLLTAAKGISEVIVTESEINVDFNDVKTVMTNGGTAIMGLGEAEGENRALAAVEKALSSPLLNDQYISGARQVLLQITSGLDDDQITMDEMGEISEYIQNEAGSEATLFIGMAYDASMGPKVRIIVVATGFSPDANINRQFDKKLDEKKKHTLTETKIETKPTYSSPSIDNPYNFEVKIKAKEEMKANSFELSVQQELPILPKAQPEVKAIPISEIKFEPIVEKKEEPKAEIQIQPKASNQEIEVKQEKTNIQSSEIVSEKIIHVLDLNENNIDTKNEKKSEETIASQPIAEKPVQQPLNSATEIKNEENEREMQLKILRERANKLKDFNEKFKSGGTGSLAELENEPAFKRRNISLDQLPHAGTSQVSRFSIGDNGENRGEIKTNNSYLHDRAD